jgi:hypothetical protein
LLSLVREIDPDKFRNNVLASADLAKYFKLPTILTANCENGSNGPLMTELRKPSPTCPTSLARARSMLGITRISYRPSRRPAKSN